MSKYSLSAERAAAGKVSPMSVITSPAVLAPQVVGKPSQSHSGGGFMQFISDYQKPLLISAGVLAVAGIAYVALKPKRKRSLGRRRSTRRRR